MLSSTTPRASIGADTSWLRARHIAWRRPYVAHLFGVSPGDLLFVGGCAYIYPSRREVAGRLTGGRCSDNVCSAGLTLVELVG